MSVEPFWIEITRPTLRQGDYLLRCLVPAFGPFARFFMRVGLPSTIPPFP
jgi:hypothetical protein